MKERLLVIENVGTYYKPLYCVGEGWEGGSTLETEFYDEVIAFCFGESKKTPVKVQDYDYEAIIKITDMVVTRWESFMNVNDSWVRKVWLGKEEVEDTASCTACGDGGCVHCRPSWFL